MIASPATRTVVDSATFTLTFTRTFTAAREAVFAAWTTPEQLRLWWDPTGAPLASCTVDLRPGGAFCFGHEEGGHAPPFAGVYRVVNPPEELVFDAMGALGTVRLEAAAPGTRMTVSIRCPSAEAFAGFLRLGVKDGTEQTLDNLVVFLAA